MSIFYVHNYSFVIELEWNIWTYLIFQQDRIHPEMQGLLLFSKSL